MGGRERGGRAERGREGEGRGRVHERECARKSEKKKEKSSQGAKEYVVRKPYNV
jgi:hypothetical protein